MKLPKVAAKSFVPGMTPEVGIFPLGLVNGKPRASSFD